MEKKNMEESSPPAVAKRLWNIVRIVFFMIRKGISKQKFMVDLHMMMKRSKIAGKKAMENLMFHHHHHHHHSNFSCRTATDVQPFYAPREYEFSCSNSPAFMFPSFHLPSNTRRKSHHHHHHHHSSKYDDMSVLHKALEMLDSEMSSPVSVLPGFGKSPMVRQLRITDSPFPLKESGDENSHVDKEAEEFIQKFYEQLKQQKRMSMNQDMIMRTS